MQDEYILWLVSESDSPMISRMVTGCDITAGGLRPAMFTATTLKLTFSPTGRPRTTYPCLSQSSLFATTHSVSGVTYYIICIESLWFEPHFKVVHSMFYSWFSWCTFSETVLHFLDLHFMKPDKVVPWHVNARSLLRNSNKMMSPKESSLSPPSLQYSMM